MGSDLIKVRLVGPAKVGTRWLKAAEEEVTAEELAVLEAEGLIDTGYVAAFPISGAETLTFTPSELEATFQARALELAQRAFDGELGRLEVEVKEIAAQAETEKAELVARLAATEAERDDLRGQVAARDGQISALTAKQNSPAGQNAGEDGAGDGLVPPGGTSAPATDTPPSEKPAKTAPKKGAAGTTKA